MSDHFYDIKYPIKYYADFAKTNNKIKSLFYRSQLLCRWAALFVRFFANSMKSLKVNRVFSIFSSSVTMTLKNT